MRPQEREGSFYPFSENAALIAVAKQLLSGRILLRNEIEDIYEQTGLSRKTAAGFTGQIRGGNFEEVTGTPIEYGKYKGWTFFYVRDYRFGREDLESVEKRIEQLKRERKAGKRVP